MLIYIGWNRFYLVRNAYSLEKLKILSPTCSSRLINKMHCTIWNKKECRISDGKTNISDRNHNILSIYYSKLNSLKDKNNRHPIPWKKVTFLAFLRRLRRFISLPSGKKLKYIEPKHYHWCYFSGDNLKFSS